MLDVLFVFKKYMWIMNHINSKIFRIVEENIS